MSNNFLLAKLAKLLNQDSTGAPLLTPQHFSISASVAANALTVSMPASLIEFRSTTLTVGVPNVRTIPSTISLVVPSGATLGTTNATAAKLTVLALDVAGTVELAIVNTDGGLLLTESSLVSTTIMSGTSNNRNVIYSTTARSNVPFRVVGYVTSTQTTAGTWAAAPTLVQAASTSPQDFKDSFTSYSIATSGYQKLPSGVIIQWGSTGGVNNGAYTATTFPIAFPSACLAVVATHISSAVPASKIVEVVVRSATSFDASGNSAGNAIYWVAIGS